MKKSIQMESDIFKELFYNLLEAYRVDIKKEYQFIYDDFYEHLMIDTTDSFNKNFRPEKISNKLLFNKNDRIEYKKTIFRNNFYRHYSSSQWFYKILKPEENKDVIRELRNRKLKEIENGI